MSEEKLIELYKLYQKKWDLFFELEKVNNRINNICLSSIDKENLDVS